MERFWSKCIPEPNSGCWLWTAALFANGYGKLTFEGKTRYAHRVAYQLASGRRPRKRQYVCHTCDNRMCVNPDHLVLATARWNVRDMHAKGRASHGPVPFGSAHHNAKLTERDIPVIRTLAAWGVPVGRLAKLYRIGHNTTKRVVDGSGWSHVP